MNRKEPGFVLVPAWDGLPSKLSWKEKVALLTYRSLQGLEQIETPVSHSFERGKYIRHVFYPAGTLLTGREHLIGHRMELISGSVLLFAPDGRFRFDAPAEMDTKPGFQAVAYMLTDCAVRTIHSNLDECRDIETLENCWFGTPESVIELGRALDQMLLEKAS